jgi:hypothetical protein
MLCKCGSESTEANKSSLEARASAVTRAHCCCDCCILSTLSYDRGKEVVSNIMSLRESMNRSENKNDLREKIHVSFCCCDVFVYCTVLIIT